MSWNRLGRSLAVSPDTISGHFPDSLAKRAFGPLASQCAMLTSPSIPRSWTSARPRQLRRLGTRDWEDPWCTLFVLRTVTMPA